MWPPWRCTGGPPMTLTLHGYWRSGTTYRCRIGLNLKGLAYETRSYDLRKGEHTDAAYRTLNPQMLVPALQTDGGVLTQSPAILEWLEERFPEPPLLPSEPGDRATVRAMAALVACDIHPLQNLRVLKALKRDLAADETQLKAWPQHWIADGLQALEQLVAEHGRGFCFGDTPTLADCYLVPQLYSARRFEVDLGPYPHLSAVEARCAAMPAFAEAQPERQPDAD